MGYDKQIISDLLRELESKRDARERVLAERRQQVYTRIPRVRQIDDTLRGTAAAVLRAALEAGDDPTAAVERLRDQNLALQQERTRLLLDHGMPADFLEDKPDCPLCGDLGYVGAVPCKCLKRMYAARLTAQLSTTLPIANQNFETFRLDYYSDKPDGRMGISARENMEYNLDVCVEYAHHFHRESPNLLLFGSAGLGKTFLSTCIAGVVTAAGFSVAYDTAIHVLGSYESVKFGGVDAAEAQRAIRKFEHADLLILDDLGTELSTAFTTSVFYSLINTRLMTRRPMIINTNLQPNEFEKRYSAAIASRLLGDFTQLRFFGDDIRLQKRHARSRS
jgi:DNA replication protein DnaC